MKWGKIALVGLQTELSASTGAFIRTSSPFADTFIMTMADGTNKYLPDKSSCDQFTYEALSSPYIRGAAEAKKHTIVKQLKQST